MSIPKQFVLFFSGGAAHWRLDRNNFGVEVQALLDSVVTETKH